MKDRKSTLGVVSVGLATGLFGLGIGTTVSSRMTRSTPPATMERAGRLTAARRAMPPPKPQIARV